MFREDELDWIQTDTLEPIIRSAVGHPDFAIQNWHLEPIQAGLGGGLGVFRLAGDGMSNQGPRSWSVILKVLGLSPEAELEIGSSHYWRREVDAYQSGLLEHLPGGIRAPRLFEAQDLPGARAALWLEDLSLRELDGPPWPLAYYGRAAYHFGLMNGAFASAGSLPNAPYWSRGFLRKFVEMAANEIKQMRELVNDPRYRKTFPDDTAEVLFQLWEARDVICSTIERLPQTFCHLDAFSRNLFLERQVDGSDRLIALDWAFAGLGALGEELSALVFASNIFTRDYGGGLAELSATSLEGYLAGLQEAGWKGSRQQVEFAFQAESALRFLVKNATSAVVGQNHHPEMIPIVERVMGCSLDQLQDTLAVMNRFLAGMGKEVLRHLPEYLP